MPFSEGSFVAATFTPMKDNGDVNYDAIDQYQKYLVDNGIRHIYVNGSTGEGPSLTTKERKEIVDRWTKLSRMPGREMKVMVQVGGTNFNDILEMAEHAGSIGVDAVSSLPPLYYLPSCVDDLVDYCKQVAAKAPKIPFYYYHIPDKTTVRLNMQEFLVKGREVIPTLGGIKYTSKDLFEGGKVLRTEDAKGQRFDFLYGTDEQVLGAFAIGFKAAVGSTYNIMPKVYQKLKREFEKGNVEEAQKCQFRSVDTVKLLFDYGERTGGLLPAMKAVLSEVCVNMGPSRYPMIPLNQSEKTKLLGQLKEMGFFYWQTQD